MGSITFKSAPNRDRPNQASRQCVNDYVRKKVKYIRVAKGLSAVQVAEGSGIPRSSYASLEAGEYKMGLDKLFSILSFLEVDINDVWPLDTIREDWVLSYRTQAFRLRELCHLTGSAGGALFKTVSRNCQTVLSHGLDQDLLERIRLFVESGQRYESGIWFVKERDGDRYSLFLKGGQSPAFLSHLVERYLQIWTQTFAEIPSVGPGGRG